MKKTAVIGASGYIGNYLWRTYRKNFPDCVGTGFSRTGNGLTPFDLRQPDVAKLKLKETGHEAVIIASAIPNIAKCEMQPKESYELNVIGTLKLVQQLEQLSIKTFFLSSDYVFNGETGSYKDDAETSPITEYGRQKAEVESEIPNLTSNYTIIRLSKIYGTVKQDGTLLDSIVACLMKNEKITAATDQFFSPTHVDDVVSMLLFVQKQQTTGVINLCNNRAYSRYQIACQLAEAFHVPSSLVYPVLLHEISGMENRPLNTSLQCSSSLHAFQPSLISITDAIKNISLNWRTAKMTQSC